MSLSTPIYTALLLGLALRLGAQPLASANPFYIGHSLVNFTMPAMTHALALDAGKTSAYAQQIINGAPLWWNFQHYANSQGTPYVDAFPDGGHDVLVLTEAVPLQNHLTWSNTYTYAALFFQYALDHSPAGQPVRFYLYETWHCVHTGLPAGCDWDQGDSLLWQPRLVHDLPLWTGIVDHVRSVFPDKEVWMVPAGQALHRLAGAIEAGQVPGMTHFTDLFDDDIHLNNKGNYFVALVMYACIFRDNPQGLIHAIPGFSDMPTAAQASVMQQTAWQAALDLAPLSGVQGISSVHTRPVATTAAYLYPNPATDAVRLWGAEPEASLRVFDAMGVLRRESRSSEVSLAGLPPGWYVVASGSRSWRLYKQ